jgi:hypothetical protein
VANPTTLTAPTNTTPNSCVDVNCDCNTIWSMAQQFSYLRIAYVDGDHKAKFIRDFAVRARRIAATYARYYLELEEGCDASKKGRFYWMALGAFASKTVACTLETWQVRTQATVLSTTTKQGLGKGNFWLFCDISGWHWYYCKHNNSFDMCLGSRNAANYVPAVKTQVSKLPWSADALPKIKQMAISPHIRTGFAKVREFEQQNDARRRPAIQLAHLLAIADHEQGVILQPLIYEDADFVAWLAAQRNLLLRWISPGLELVFSSACSTNTAALKSVAPEDTKLEDLKSRMDWIQDAAKQFHKLMNDRRTYMEGELATMAGWVGMADR